MSSKGTIYILRNHISGLFRRHILNTEIKQKWPFSRPPLSPTSAYVIYEWSHRQGPEGNSLDKITNAPGNEVVKKKKVSGYLKELVNYASRVEVIGRDGHRGQCIVYKMCSVTIFLQEYNCR